MSEVVIEVDGQREDISGLWVHFQEPTRAPAFGYRIMVPSEFIRPVFDPLSVETKRHRWVIAAVDCTREVPEGIEIVGKALRFDPSLYV